MSEKEDKEDQEFSSYLLKCETDRFFQLKTFKTIFMNWKGCSALNNNSFFIKKTFSFWNVLKKTKQFDKIDKS